MNRSDYYLAGVTNCVSSGMTYYSHVNSGVSYYTGYPLLTCPRSDGLIIKIVPGTTVYLKETTQPPIVYRAIIKKEVIYMKWDIWNILIVALIAVIAAKVVSKLSWYSILKTVAKGLVWPIQAAWNKVKKEKGE